MKLDAIQSVAQEKLEAELKPISDQLSRFRAVLDAYEGILRDDIERRVYNTILVALGQPEKPASQHGDLEDLERARLALREALNELSTAIEGSEGGLVRGPAHNGGEAARATATAEEGRHERGHRGDQAPALRGCR